MSILKQPKFILILLYLFLFPGIFFPLLAQGDWQWINPLPQGNNLNGVSFVNDNLGMAVGNAGMILKTTDGGQSWTILESNTREDLLAVSFVNANVAYVSGTSKTIMKTTDGGASWIALTTGLIYNLPFRCIHFVDTQVGWMGGQNYMLKTLDGGNSWYLYRQYDPYDIYNIFALSADRCFYVGFGGINRTTNGGQTWTRASSVPSAYSYNDIFFINQNEGWTVGDGGVLLKTIDGGNVWSSLPNLGFAYGGRLFFKNQNLGWVASYDGILKTTDGGNTWNLKSTATVAKFSFSTTNGFAVGQKGRIYKSTDEGNTWQSLRTSFAREINFKKVFFNDPQVGFILGDSGRVYRTTDGGFTWQETQILTSDYLYSMYFTDSKTGWIGGSGFIFKTTNGIDWNFHYSTDDWKAFKDIQFYNSQIGCGVGFRIHITSDGGHSWQMKYLPGDYSDYNLNSVYFISDQKIITVGDQGKICYSNDGGNSWTSIISPTSNELKSVKFIDQNVGFIITNDGVILKTTDAGLSWQLNYSTTSYWFNDLFIVDNNHLWIACQGKYLDYAHKFLLSTDGGNSWNVVQADNDFNTTNIFFNDLNTGWLVTENACLLKYSDNLAIPAYPSNLIASSSSSSIILNWQDNSNNETGFKVYRSDYYSGAYQKIAELGAEITSYHDMNVSPNIVYWYRLTAYNPIGESAKSREDSAALILPLPDTPILLSPSNNSINQPIELDLIWNAVSNANKYHLQVSLNYNFTNLIVNDSTITVTAEHLAFLSHDTRYYWKVAAKNAAGKSNWSETWRFTTVIAAPDVPVLVYPADNSASMPTIFTFRWNSSPRAATYHLQVSASSDFITKVFDDSTLTVTSQQVGPLENSTIYYWRVRAKNAGGTSAWSFPERSFTTIMPLPNQVLLLSPLDAAVIENDSVKLVWRQCEPAVNRYWFELATSSQMSNATIDTMLMAQDTTKVVSQLVPNQSYWWRVKARNLAGWGPYSEKRKFNIVIAGIKASQDIILEFNLNQNYPNPFNPTTVIQYIIPKASSVELSVFDVLGQELTVLVNERQEAGIYQVQFECQDLPAGLYFYRLRAGEFCETKKMVIVK